MTARLSQLERRLVEGHVVAFIGAGASASYTDENGNTIEGVPTAAGLVDLMSKQQPSVIEPSAPFEEAAYLFEKAEGKQELLTFLSTHIGKIKSPLPAHRFLAALPFGGFVSMNFDALLERALDQQGRRYRLILTDQDVGLTADQSNEVAVLKPHGCLSRRETIIATADKVLPFLERSPLLDAYLRVLVANKTILFLGFSLTDADFRSLVQSLHARLGTIPKSYAVALGVKEFQRTFWADHNIEVVDQDLTKFLQNLYVRLANASEGIVQAVSPVLNDPLFHGIPAHLRSLPTETQAIEAFLSGVLDRLASSSQTLAEIKVAAETAITGVMERKKNFQAFEHLGNTITNILADSRDKPEAEEKISGLRLDREKIVSQFKDRGHTVFEKPKRLLLYSQSMRVSQLLHGVPPGTIQKCEIFIAECRPKSPRIFADAVKYAEHLSDLHATITIIPDAAIWHLFDQRRIDLVLLGAHKVFKEGDQLHSFINTCGSGIIATLCEQFSIPLWIVAEREKCVPNQSSRAISFVEEVSLLPWPGLPLTSLGGGNVKAEFRNIGYDFVVANTMTRLVTEAEI